MLYKVPEAGENQTYHQKTEAEDSYDKLYPKQETTSPDISADTSGMFSASLPNMTSSPVSSPSYHDAQSVNNLGYPGSMYVPGSRSVLPSMQYLSNTNQMSSASFWGMQPSDLGYSHGANSGSQLSKPFASFDGAQTSTASSPTSRADGMAYPAPGSIARPNPYSSYMGGADISPWSMAIQQGLHRIGSGKPSLLLLTAATCTFQFAAT